MKGTYRRCKECGKLFWSINCKIWCEECGTKKKINEGRERRGDWK